MFWIFSKKHSHFICFFLPIGDKKKTESKNEMRFIDRCSLGRWAQIIKQAVQNYTMFFNISMFLKALMRSCGLNVSALQLRNKKAGHLSYHILCCFVLLVAKQSQTGGKQMDDECLISSRVKRSHRNWPALSCSTLPGWDICVLRFFLFCQDIWKTYRIAHAILIKLHAVLATHAVRPAPKNCVSALEKGVT